MSWKSLGAQQAQDAVKCGAEAASLGNCPFSLVLRLFLSFGFLPDFGHKTKTLDTVLILNNPSKMECLLLKCSRKHLRDIWKAVMGLVEITSLSLNQSLWSEDGLVWSFRTRLTSQILRQRLTTSTTEKRGGVMPHRNHVITIPGI